MGQTCKDQLCVPASQLCALRHLELLSSICSRSVIGSVMPEVLAIHIFLACRDCLHSFHNIYRNIHNLYNSKQSSSPEVKSRRPAIQQVGDHSTTNEQSTLARPYAGARVSAHIRQCTGCTPTYHCPRHSHTLNTVHDEHGCYQDAPLQCMYDHLHPLQLPGGVGPHHNQVQQHSSLQ
jgi:hypothetical protein